VGTRISTQALVLRTVDYGEADRIVTLLTRELGKISALARGARRSQKRFGAGLALFGVGEATLVDKPGAELLTLEGFAAARGFPRIGLDVAKVALGGYVSELVRELVPVRQPDEAVFALAVDMLALLDEDDPRAEMMRVFELKLLEAVGLRPTLDHCLVCGEEAAMEDDGPSVGFDPTRGGLVCASCRSAGAGGRALSPRAWRLLVAAQELSIAALRGGAERLGLVGRDNVECRDALAAFIEAHLGRPLKSVEFIHKLRDARFA
jgi:DNA repair protein RecO (recombination protein O)